MNIIEMSTKKLIEIWTDSTFHSTFAYILLKEYNIVTKYDKELFF